MKKILLSTIVVGLLSVNSMANNSEIAITGTVLPSAVVGFVDVSGEALTDTDKFIDATINLGSHEVDAFNSGALAASSQSIFVKTNIATTGSVSMSINSANPDKTTLVNAVDSTATIPVVYKIGTTNITPDGLTFVTIANTANAGSTAITDKFTITPSAAADQLSGTYGAVLTVAIVAN